MKEMEWAAYINSRYFSLMLIFFFQSTPDFGPPQLFNLLLQGGVSVASYPGPPGPPVSINRNIIFNS